MNHIESIDQSMVENLELVAESNEFAIYALGEETYLLVHRHAGTPWTAVRLSGDGVCRVGLLIVGAMRHLYREVASNLSPNNQKDSRQQQR